MFSGASSSAEVCALEPSPLSPAVPVALPATVYTSYGLIDWPHLVWLICETIWIRLFHASAMYRSPPAYPPMNTDTGLLRSDDVAAFASPPVPGCPGTPATVYRSPATGFAMFPHGAEDAAISATRSLPVSAMNRSPLSSTATPDGSNSSDADAAVPLGESPCTPVGLPAMVYTSPAVIEIPHCVPLAAGISCTRFPAESAT